MFIVIRPSVCRDVPAIEEYKIPCLHDTKELLARRRLGLRGIVYVTWGFNVSSHLGKLDLVSAHGQIPGRK